MYSFAATWFCIQNSLWIWKRAQKTSHFPTTPLFYIHYLLYFTVIRTKKLCLLPVIILNGNTVNQKEHRSRVSLVISKLQLQWQRLTSAHPHFHCFHFQPSHTHTEKDTAFAPTWICLSQRIDPINCHLSVSPLPQKNHN